jgi:hypothetical protein
MGWVAIERVRKKKDNAEAQKALRRVRREI